MFKNQPTDKNEHENTILLFFVHFKRNYPTAKFTVHYGRFQTPIKGFKENAELKHPFQ